jgi:hypothetical protein
VCELPGRACASSFSGTFEENAWAKNNAIASPNSLVCPLLA